MRLGFLLTLTVVCEAVLLQANRLRGCQTQVRLRDKWRFLHHGRRPYIRIRRRAIIFRNGALRVRLKCVESRGNIYLLRKSSYYPGQDAVLCVGFSLVADHPHAEYTVIRLMQPGIGSHMMSPILVPHGQRVTIDSVCDFQEPQDRQQFAFIQRAAPGCKFQNELHGDWNFTYIHAHSLVIRETTMTLILLDGHSMVFICDTRDSSNYVIRTHGYPSPDKDSYMCVNFAPVEDDIFYSFMFSRLNSGTVMDNMLQTVEKGERLHLHQDCDWLDSPARPEFLSP